MKLYNSLTRQVEPFAPADGRTVRMYVCGVTPYDTTHIGHAMTYLTFDVVTRYCQHLGWRVKYVQNVTDIDDDILRKASEVGEPWDRLGERYIRQFQEDLNALNVLPPSVYPRATEEIPEMLKIIDALIRDGCAYVREGNVYFRVSCDRDYGHLSGYDRSAMRALSAERGANPDDPFKEDPLDFILWQASRPGEPAWESPWGSGRPGWHIECSAMSMRYLGPQLDIHGGGADLVYPHHESEIAQSESFSQVEPFSRFWVHVAMVHYQGEKMSKSLGNLVLVRDLLRHTAADTIRLYLHSHHYRHAFAYEDDDLRAFEPLVGLLRKAVVAPSGPHPFDNLAGHEARFYEAIENDLDTPSAVGILREMAQTIVDGAERRRHIDPARESLRRVASILGLTTTR